MLWRKEKPKWFLFDIQYHAIKQRCPKGCQSIISCSFTIGVLLTLDQDNPAMDKTNWIAFMQFVGWKWRIGVRLSIFVADWCKLIEEKNPCYLVEWASLHYVIKQDRHQQQGKKATKFYFHDCYWDSSKEKSFLIQALLKKIDAFSTESETLSA